MTEDQAIVSPDRSVKADPPLSHYVYWGGLAGVVASLATLFVISSHYAHTLGHGSATCVVVGCTTTAMLSHVGGMLGLAVGSACGAIIGAIAHLMRRSSRTS